MAWTTPGTAVAGAVLEASFWNSNVRDNLIMGGPVYTNEAARDAAITSPSEGMRAYLTASTVATATGAITAIPSGVMTVYNGTHWVSVTPVGARSLTDATTTSSSFVTTLTGDSTAISVTLTTGTTARIDMNAVVSGSNVSNAYITYSVSGATTITALDDNSVFAAVAGATYTVSLSGSAIITGLTAGTNTFTLNYRQQGGVTATYNSRNLIVQGIA